LIRARARARARARVRLRLRLGGRLTLGAALAGELLLRDHLGRG